MAASGRHRDGSKATRPRKIEGSTRRLGFADAVDLDAAERRKAGESLHGKNPSLRSPIDLCPLGKVAMTKIHKGCSAQPTSVSELTRRARGPGQTLPASLEQPSVNDLTSTGGLGQVQHQPMGVFEFRPPMPIGAMYPNGQPVGSVSRCGEELSIVEIRGPAMRW
jgi:hypothetical protein